MAQLRALIFNLGRDNRMNLARHQTIALHLAQCLRQHLLADTGHGLAQLVEAHHFPVVQLFEHNQCPLVGNITHQLLRDVFHLLGKLRNVTGLG
mgnify:CR=1 FL=1